jgi:hypothetical protein
LLFLQLPSSIVSKPLHFVAATLVTGLLILGLSACGSGTASRGVATVGKTKISQSTLNHWMSATLGSDYHNLVRSTAPVGLVSEPADYPRCVATARTIKPKSLPASVPNEARLKIRCRQLYVAIKEQALSTLIAGLWRVEEGAELGQNVSDREVSRQVQEVAYRDYKSPAAFRRFLASEHWSLADERYLAKTNLIETKFIDRLNRHVASLGGSRQTYARLVRENVAKWSARTHCSPGYTAWQCRPSGSTAEADPSASILVEKLGRVAGAGD